MVEKKGVTKLKSNEKNKIRILLTALVLVCSLMLLSVALAVGGGFSKDNQSCAASRDETPEHIYIAEGEMAAVWVPYMSLADLSEEKIDKIIADCKALGANAIVFHVRPFGDALYKSQYFPWSHLVGGEQGRAPEFDPLEYIISKAHAQNLAVHAWINPFRIRSESGKTPAKLSELNQARIWLEDDIAENDHFVIEYNSGLYYNPGEDAVRKLIVDGVREIVENYNIDGIHFDDYFYPANDAKFDDSVSYERYKNAGGSRSLLEWRTENVNTLIREVYSAVKEADKNCVFGISPQGNIQNCLNMGADVYEWCANEGYIDYICPQIYWSFEHKIKPFAETCEEWRNIIKVENISLYVGLALYKAGSEADNGQWLASDDIIARQIEYLRNTKTSGFFIYSYEYLSKEQTAREVENIKEKLAQTIS